MKYSFTVLIFCCCIILTFMCYLIYILLNSDVKIFKDHEPFKMAMANFFSSHKKQCQTEQVYCFGDSDCNAKCSTSNICLNGICKLDPGYVNPSDLCDTKMGMVGYLVGNPEIGGYDWICKSVDPAIAISNTENRMCFNGTIEFDYAKHFPEIESCECDDKIIIPATLEKRKHVECNSIYKDLIVY